MLNEEETVAAVESLQESVADLSTKLEESQSREDSSVEQIDGLRDSIASLQSTIATLSARNDDDDHDSLKIENAKLKSDLDRALAQKTADEAADVVNEKIAELTKKMRSANPEEFEILEREYLALARAQDGLLERKKAENEHLEVDEENKKLFIQLSRDVDNNVKGARAKLARLTERLGI